MKSLISVLLAGFSLLPLAASARASDFSTEGETYSGIYVRGDLGASYLNWPSAESNRSYVGSAGIGYQFDQNFRSDLTYNWAGEYTLAPGTKLSTSAVLGSMYYELKNDTAITPYVGAGVGYGWQWANGTLSNSQGITVGLDAGVAYAITNNLALDAGYRFQDIFGNAHDAAAHQISAGLRVKF